MSGPLEPISVSIAETARLTGESEWQVKDKLRKRIYAGKKSGRRTLIIYESVKQHIATLSDATYAAPRARKVA
jgi:hypothetical protein